MGGGLPGGLPEGQRGRRGPLSTAAEGLRRNFSIGARNEGKEKKQGPCWLCGHGAVSSRLRAMEVAVPSCASLAPSTLFSLFTLATREKQTVSWRLTLSASSRSSRRRPPPQVDVRSTSRAGAPEPPNPSDYHL